MGKIFIRMINFKYHWFSVRFNKNCNLREATIFSDAIRTHISAILRVTIRSYNSRVLENFSSTLALIMWGTGLVHARSLASSLLLNRQISAVVKSSFFNLKSTAKVKHFLSKSDLEIVIHSLISSRLDYCNSLYTGPPQTASSSLQLFQNTGTSLLTVSRNTDHIMPVLASLH